MKSAPLVLAGIVAALTAGCADSASSGALGPATSAGDGDWPFEVEELDRFDEPWAMAFLPDGDLLVTERSGVLHLRDADSGERVEVAGVPTVADSGQAGLGDVLPAPTYDEDGTVYLSWAEEGDGGIGAVVGRARLVTDGAPRLDGLEVIWRQTPRTERRRPPEPPAGLLPGRRAPLRLLGRPTAGRSRPGHLQHPRHDRAADPRRRPRAGQPAGGRGRGDRGDLDVGPPQPAGSRARARRDALVLRDGSRGRRRAQPRRGRFELRLARGVQRQRLRRGRDPRPRRGRRLRRPGDVVDPEHLARAA